MASFTATLGPLVTKLIMQVGFGIIAVIILAVLFFSSKYYFAWRKKRKSYRVSAVIFNPDGTWYMQLIGKFKGKDNIDKMEFINSTETCPVINPKYIRANKVCLWRYGPEQYAVIPPTIWERMNPEDFKIDVIDLQMKNFAFLEQRAAVSRWAYMKDMIQKYAPYITVLLVLIFAGISIYFIMKAAIGMFGDAVAQRVAECSSIVGGGSAPAA